MKGQTRDEHGNIYGAASPRLNPSLPSVMLSNTNGNLAMLPELKLSPLAEENEVDSPSVSSPKAMRKAPVDTSLHSEDSGNVEVPDRVNNTRTSSVPVTARERVRSYSFDDFDDQQQREDSPPSTPRPSPTANTSAPVGGNVATGITGTYHIALTLPEKTLIKRDSIPNRYTGSSTNNSIMVNNRELYRAHRKMRLAVLEASKRFEEETARRILAEIHTAHNSNPDTGGSNKIAAPGNGKNDSKPGLIMRRGTQNNKQLSSESVRKLLAQREKEHQKSLNEASKRGGRTRRQRVVSDLSSMMNSNSSHQSRGISNTSVGDNSKDGYIKQNSRSIGRSSLTAISASPTRESVANNTPDLNGIFEAPATKNGGTLGDYDNGGMLSASSSDGNLVTLAERDDD